MSNKKIRVTLNVMALLSERETDGEREREKERVREQTGYRDEDGLLGVSNFIV